jgi:putative intracellular protease/amidase
MKIPKILMIVTSHAKLGESGQKTGFWLEELAVPYREFVKAGAEVEIASPDGGRAPADPKSEKTDSDDVRDFLGDPVATGKLDSTRRIDQIDEDYDAVFVAGGHGVMWDLASSTALAGLLKKTFERGAVVAAVCHGPAALVGVKLSNGEPLVRGRRVAGFSNQEETAAELDRIVPFLLESRLTELGARYERGPMWKPFVVSDNRLVTGQNPASSRETALATLEAIRNS